MRPRRSLTRRSLCRPRRTRCASSGTIWPRRSRAPSRPRWRRAGDAAVPPLLALICLLPQAPAAAGAAGDTLSDAAARVAIARGVEFLVQAQNADGSWGGPRNKTMTDSFANVATHDAWTLATTGLCCVALLELGQVPAAIRACDR